MTMSPSLLHGAGNTWMGLKLVLRQGGGQQNAYQTTHLSFSVASTLAAVHPLGQTRGGLGNFEQIVHYLACILELKAKSVHHSPQSSTAGSSRAGPGTLLLTTRHLPQHSSGFPHKKTRLRKPKLSPNQQKMETLSTLCKIIPCFSK